MCGTCLVLASYDSPGALLGPLLIAREDLLGRLVGRLVCVTEQSEETLLGAKRGRNEPLAH